MANINKIRLSGTTYNIEDANAAKTVELTQAQYDALVSSGTVDPNTFYIITDATAGDLTNYYTKTETNTLLGGKQATLVSGTNIKTINNESILGSGNIDIQGGGGKAIEAGRGIAITTGATADTVSFNLAIYDRGNTSCVSECHDENSNIPICRSSYCHLEHPSGSIGSSSNSSHKEGTGSKIGGNSNNSHVEGYKCEVGDFSPYSHAEGQFTKTSNQSEHASGQYNVSSHASFAFGNSGNTLFSVGNGTSTSARHNAFEIRQNGDIYLTKDGQDVKLQDQLGGGGSSYTAGDGIDITNDVISVTGKVDTSTYNTYTAATNTALASKADTSAVTESINAAVSGKVDTSTYNTYTAATNTALASKANTATTYTKTEVDNAITAATSTKQDALVSGTNIKTINNESLLGSGNIVIQGGGGEGCTVDEKVLVEDYKVLPYNSSLTNVYYAYNFDDGGTPSDNQIACYFAVSGSSTFVYCNDYINFVTGGHTGNTSSWETYYNVTWDSGNTRFLFETNEGYCFTNFSRSSSEVLYQIPLATLSGTPCQATSTLGDVVERVSKKSQDSIKNFYVNTYEKEINFQSVYNNGNDGYTNIKLKDLKCDNRTLETDINIGLGTSGWTTLTPQESFVIDNLNEHQMRFTYGSGISSLSEKEVGLRIIFNGYLIYNPTINFSTDTTYTISNDLPNNLLTTSYDSVTSALTVSIPTSSVTISGEEGMLSIERVNSNYSKFGQGITVETYGELTQPLIPYVQETRTALGGMSIVKLTQSQYDALSPNYDSNTLYVIVN